MSPYLRRAINTKHYDQSSKCYELCSVVRHIGLDFRCGHYVTDKLNKGVWQRCDDSIISKINQVERSFMQLIIVIQWSNK